MVGRSCLHKLRSAPSDNVIHVGNRYPCPGTCIQNEWGPEEGGGTVHEGPSEYGILIQLFFGQRGLCGRWVPHGLCDDLGGPGRTVGWYMSVWSEHIPLLIYIFFARLIVRERFRRKEGQPICTIVIQNNLNFYSLSIVSTCPDKLATIPGPYGSANGFPRNVLGRG